MKLRKLSEKPTKGVARPLTAQKPEKFSVKEIEKMAAKIASVLADPKKTKILL
jgi:hypothetical protein